jgi:hypothetical protein
LVDEVWGRDPVHPSSTTYRKIADNLFALLLVARAPRTALACCPTLFNEPALAPAFRGRWPNLYTVSHTVNLALLTSSFVWLIQLSSLHISLFKVTIMEFFTQGKCEFVNFLFALLDKMKILTL